jgi:hypothetical protein
MEPRKRLEGFARLCPDCEDTRGKRWVNLSLIPGASWWRSFGLQNKSGHDYPARPFTWPTSYGPMVDRVLTRWPAQVLAGFCFAGHDEQAQGRGGAPRIAAGAVK